MCLGCSMSQIIEKMVLAGLLSKEQTRLIENNVAHFTKTAEQDPEFLENAIEKLANPFGVMIPETLKMMGATALAAGGAALVGDLYRTAKNAIVKSRNYKAMIDSNPELSGMDAQAVQRAFNTLHNFNPSYAADPSVAGQYVKRQMETQGTDWGLLKNVIDAGRSLHTSRPSPIDYLTQPQTIAQMLQFENISPYAKAQQEEAAKKRREKRESEIHAQNLAKAEAARVAEELRVKRNIKFNQSLGLP